MVGGVAMGGATAPWMECESFAFEGLALSPEAEQDFFTNGHVPGPFNPRSNPAPRPSPPCTTSSGRYRGPRLS